MCKRSNYFVISCTNPAWIASSVKRKSTFSLTLNNTCANEVFDLIKSRASSRVHYNIKMRTGQEFLHSARPCNHQRRTLTIFLRPFIEATRRLLRNSRMRTCFSRSEYHSRRLGRGSLRNSSLNAKETLFSPPRVRSTRCLLEMKTSAAIHHRAVSTMS
jgi:hypothetical protein